ncbi:MAG: cytoplasmic filament protein CfpA, partial [Deltaproteobacteria bacterium]|nr:cytoplasmic filament protein CfpA [Deltaproteobacteria bacterium]
VETIVKDIISKHIQDAMDKELSALNDSLVDEGKPELTADEKIFERIKALDNHISDDELEGSKRYTHITKKVLDSVEGVRAEIEYEEYDPMRIRENVVRLLESENIRNRGFNTAINALTHVLDWSRMGYQHIENFKGARKAVIREYADTEETILPDERYVISLDYSTYEMIQAERVAYSAQFGELKRTIMEAWNVVEKVYEEDRRSKRKEDWETLYKRMSSESKDEGRGWFFGFGGGGSSEEDFEEETPEAAPTEVPQWNEVVFLTPKDSSMVVQNPTMINDTEDLRQRFQLMRDSLQKVFQEATPEVREVLDNRIDFLEREFSRFSMRTNPFHVNPGVMLEVDIVSIKKKSTTMMNMANVLNEFLSAISKGFQDAAFASFSRRRSTQRSDLAEGFGESADEVEDARHHAAAGGGGSGEEIFE